MSIMKQIVSIVAFVLLAFSAVAQQTNNTQAGSIQAQDLKASLVNKNLVITWVTKSASGANYWEVQGSKDGTNYSTIGLVLGEDPKSTGTSYFFKQDNNKIKPGMIYYRVLHIESEDRAAASNSIRLSK